MPMSETPLFISKSSSGIASKLSRNIVASLIRVTVNTLVAFVLPAYLTSRLPVAVYGAWVLILQLGAYVSFLDLGIQTGVAKFVAEYEAKGDDATASRYASAGLAMTSIAGLAGIALTGLLAWRVPELFSKMPASLYSDVRSSVLLVGVSLSVVLFCSTFSAVFIGLQRYAVPMALVVVNRVSFTCVVCLAIAFHGGLRSMAAAAAIVNVATASMQVLSWSKLVSHIRLAWQLIDRAVFSQMIKYCSYLGLWSVGMLCVNGLDVTIVGHYDYPMTAFYSIAVMPTNLILLIISAVMGPVMPASSALSTARTSSEMGVVLIKVTRYAMSLLLLSGLPLIVFGYVVIRIWVGPLYAIHSIPLMRVLIVANILRNSCLPYSTMVIATGRQKSATIAPIAEAVVNLASSIYLASRFGAIGVAYGTLIGALVSVGCHFALSMPATSDTLSISRGKLLWQGIALPGLMALPSLAMTFFWVSSPTSPLNLWKVLAWVASTLSIAWFAALSGSERDRIFRAVVSPPAAQAI